MPFHYGVEISYEQPWDLSARSHADILRYRFLRGYLQHFGILYLSYSERQSPLKTQGNTEYTLAVERQKKGENLLFGIQKGTLELS